MVLRRSPSTRGSTMTNATPIIFWTPAATLTLPFSPPERSGIAPSKQGHSLGTIQVLFYAATHWEHDIKAVVQLSVFGDLPWRICHLQIQDEDKFRALSEAALKALHDGKERDVMALRMAQNEHCGRAPDRRTLLDLSCGGIE